MILCFSKKVCKIKRLSRKAGIDTGISLAKVEGDPSFKTTYCEAAVVYRKPLATQKVGEHRLSKG